MKEIRLTKGYVALVDDCDYDRVSQFSWYAEVRSNTVYARHNLKRVDGVRPTPLWLHRFVLGVTDPKIEVDHEDHNGLNCQRYNLRACVHEQNQCNQRKTRGSSKYKGVSWNKAKNKWDSKIETHGKTIHLGRFTSEVKAAQKYDAAAKQHHGEFAHLNFPETVVQ